MWETCRIIIHTQPQHMHQLGMTIEMTSFTCFMMVFMHDARIRLNIDMDSCHALTEKAPSPIVFANGKLTAAKASQYYEYISCNYST